MTRSRAGKRSSRAISHAGVTISADPIQRFQVQLIKEGLITQEDADRIEAEAQQAIEEAVKFAEESPEPDVANILEGVYVE